MHRSGYNTPHVSCSVTKLGDADNLTHLSGLRPSKTLTDGAGIRAVALWTLLIWVPKKSTTLTLRIAHSQPRSYTLKLWHARPHTSHMYSQTFLVLFIAR